MAKSSRLWLGVGLIVAVIFGLLFVRSEASVSATQSAASEALEVRRIKASDLRDCLREGLADFTALYISHLRFEEDLVMPVLNESLTDEQLAQVTSDIRMSVPPPEMCIFIRYMAPSMNPAERADMLRGMRLAPPEIFEMFRDAAERCLSASDYQRLAVDAGFA